jgi:MFS family permease
MPLLLLGATLLGSTSSANYASRYAATDLAPAQSRGRALAVVVWATTIGAVAGPNLTGPAASLAHTLGIPELTGPFALGAAGMLVAAVVVAIRLRPDPLLTARQLHADAVSDGTATSGQSQPIREILRERPVLVAAMVAMAAAHAVMISVMVMTPLHMAQGHATLKVIGVVISLHVLGMYAFAPLFGIASDRLGPPRVLLLGGAVLLAALLVCARAPEGSSAAIFVGLFLLGVGWSVTMVAASTLVAQQAPLASLTVVQGTADLAMSLAAAVGGAASGVIVSAFGFSVLAAYASIFAFFGLLASLWAARLVRVSA